MSTLGPQTSVIKSQSSKGKMSKVIAKKLLKSFALVILRYHRFNAISSLRQSFAIKVQLGKEKMSIHFLIQNIFAENF